MKNPKETTQGPGVAVGKVYDYQVGRASREPKHSMLDDFMAGKVSTGRKKNRQTKKKKKK